MIFRTTVDSTGKFRIIFPTYLIFVISAINVYVSNDIYFKRNFRLQKRGHRLIWFIIAYYAYELLWLRDD